MREILFRGKGTHGFAKGKWVYGYYLKEFWGENRKGFGIHLIEGGYSEVDPETVGQYTGLTDKNGNKIFEGDVVNILTENEEIGVVAYDDGGFLVEADGFCVDFHANINGTDLEVIGNIHDNPELLKKG